jgi:DNA-binding GntR family transcriptional regulator
MRRAHRGTIAAIPQRMTKHSVHEAARTLHAALAEARTLSPEQRAELEQVLRDVERALGAREKPLAERASELTARFETEHPKLAESIAALARALAGVGI